MLVAPSQSKKVRETTHISMSRVLQGGLRAPGGLPIGSKIKVSKYGHIIYQSIANFVDIQKNIKTICPKPIDNPL